MARRVRDRDLETREARQKLKARGKPFYRQIEPGLHLGYRKRQNGSGTWEARHYIGGERYHREKIGTADDASDADGVAVLSFWQAQDAARERMVTRAHNAAGKSGPVTIDVIMGDYLGFIAHERKDQINACSRVNQFILPDFGGREAASITADEIRLWHRKLATTPARVRSTKKGDAAKRKQKFKMFDTEEAKRKRKASANRILTVFKAALNRAFEDGKITDDRAWRRVKPYASVNAARIRFLDIAEAGRLINASNPDFRRLLQAALFSGCRVSELTRLTVADFAPGQLRGKGKSVAATIAVRESKSGKPRYVYLNDEGVQFFISITAGRAGDETLLLRANGAPWKSGEQGRPMAEAVKRAKIKPPISFHGLRHSYASLSLMNGVPMLVLAHNLGHRDSRMCERHYAHLTKDYEADAIRKGAPSFGFMPNKKVVHIGGRR